MQALTITPGQKDSLDLADLPEPEAAEGSVLVETLAVGLCATDREVIADEFGTAPEGRDYLVMGHENLGRVLEAPEGSGLAAGDLVVGIVRRPCAENCRACAAGEWDMCHTGNYTEHGIEALDGFARERWRGEPEDMVKLKPSLERVGVLLEPATILAKAWEQVDRIGSRAYFRPHVVAVTGAGPVGLLAALLGIQRGMEVHVFDLEEGGPKEALTKELGAVFHTESLAESGVSADITIECTGAPAVIREVLQNGAKNSVTCLTGVSEEGGEESLDLGALNLSLVMDNRVVFGTINANRRHYLKAAEALAKADTSWLDKIISRRVALADYEQAFEDRDGDIKVVLDLA
ncbi:glucose 1-dehydrogenase [Arthrobacter sp. zg-Y20]|uniref:glucose 1-dehydrogenase n=1 Tax=unclassified Arthrobacter TaxID=235627 RepID=UPI001D135235|nr:MULTISPECIES: glucose 1-dehydrogenase [unclassified Arthrobacter]MCC3275257.1 glucose 1-dehydrogenase [Arthrobacter sp. zg-Y20]MDK1315414.1 glucose 1-dehydrogenase [Arthrobacter sp. zg.Y20]WIB05831.1 glucose 1-dehydrogenase [Arthrobacter sp. zg-Y20]